MYQLDYDEDTQEIYILLDGKRNLIESDFPSKPLYSPNGSKAAYISPLEWECLGSLYLVDLNTGDKTVLIEPDGQKIPKSLLWINDDLIAVIIGFGMGTIAIGGNIFLYNISTRKLEQITNLDDKYQITELSSYKDNVINYKGIKYIDDHYNDFTQYIDSIKIGAL